MELVLTSRLKQVTMQNKNPLQIRVQEPCMQSWSEMLPENNGRFCGACTQTVIDFSTYTDEQLLAFFSTNNTDRVCGRFRDTQVGTTLQAGRPWWTSIRSIAAILLPFLMTSRADAQRQDTVAQVEGREPGNVRTVKLRAIMGKPIVNRIEPVKPIKNIRKEESDLIHRRKERED
jgi:hypothetical protein